MSEAQDKRFEDVEFGEDLAEVAVDVSLETVKVFAEASQMLAPRFTDHEQAREAGLPGAIVPGIMSQGILVGLIHAWAPNAEVQFVDTIFRSPLLVDSKPTASGVVTDIDEDARVIEIDLTLKNEKGDTPVLGTAKVTL